MRATRHGESGVLLGPREFWNESPVGNRYSEYRLPEEQRPHSIRIGRSRFYTETPSQWIERLKREQLGEDER